MSNRKHILTASLALAALCGGARLLPALAASPFAVQAEAQLKESDHKKAGKVVGAWIKANIESKDIAKSKEAMWEHLAKWTKKSKKEPLSMTADLGRALWHARGYDKIRVKKKGSIVEVEVGEGDAMWSYSVHVPSKYKASSGPYPLILMVPESYQDGEKPKDWIVEEWVSGEVRDNAILAVVHMPEDPKTWDVLLNEDRTVGGLGTILRTFNELQKTYALDFNRVFLAGRMEGLPPVMQLASMFPDRFAGVVGRSGDIPEDFAFENFKNLPTWFSGPGAGVTAFEEAVREAGYDNCTIQPEGKELDCWNWMTEQVRVANPEEVVLVPGTPLPNKAYWLEVPPWDGTGTARITGKIDRTTNTVTIDGEGVVEVYLYFNDQLVDLDREVTVICNGVTHTDIIPRSITTLERTILSTRTDPGKVYVCSKQYDLPATSSPKAEGDEEAAGGE